MRSRLLLVLFLLAGLLAVPPAIAGLTAANETPPPAALLALHAATDGELDYGLSPSTGTFSMVRATGDAVLAPTVASQSPEQAARGFLGAHGAVLGMSSLERRQVLEAAAPPAGFGGSALSLAKVETDKVTGITHVVFDQSFRGMPVFGGRVIVHLGGGGVTAVNGVFVPNISVGSALFSLDAAKPLAIDAIAEHHPDEALAVSDATTQIYHSGLVDGRPAPVLLTHVVVVEGRDVADQVLVSASDGAIVNVLPLRHEHKDRCVYTPAYVNPTGNDELAVRDEGEPATNAPPLDNLYDYSGQTYDFFEGLFGRDSFDGAGHKMRTVYDATAVCPNANWNGRTTNYCNGVTSDDVVAHEWGHAYTQGTHGLIYLNQPGALNESYSDIWGELVDLTNGVDGIGGADNVNPSPVGQRWIVGEDLKEVGEALALRDMWDPESRSAPGKVSSPYYVCGTGDGGGVHTNSSVPNHAFAMLVDGKTYNGHTIGAIGMTKAAHIYFQAMTAYQTPTSGFAEHAQALRAGCADLTGVALNPIPGEAAGQAITGDDCAQVDEAIAAVELEVKPAQCGGPLLDQATPAPCPGGSTLFSEDWETGSDGWTFERTAVNPAMWAGHDFALTSDLPADRNGSAAFAQASRLNGCAGTNVGGVVTINGVSTSPPKPNPAGRVSVTSSPIAATDDGLTLRFNHYVANEVKDGGNVLISVNGGAFAPLATSRYTFNPPKTVLPAANPKSGQTAWSGTDTGLLTGSWGTSIARLDGAVNVGDTFTLRFESGQDCTGGVTGWYVDEIAVVSCPTTEAPALALGADYTEPDDGTFTLAWNRPAEATGPDRLEEAVIGAPIFAEDAESGLEGWTTSTEGTGAIEWRSSAGKPGHASQTFYAQGNEATTNTASFLTSNDAVAIPASGQTVLTFKEWSYNHAGDKTIVEVSDDGTTWSQVFLRSTPYVAAGEANFVAEPMFSRTVDLSAFAGKSVFLRLAFRQGPEIYVDVTRFGWYVDDLAVSNIVWQEVATVAGTSHTLTRPTGTYLYRVSTLYGTRPSQLSNVVTARVA